MIAIRLSEPVRMALEVVRPGSSHVGSTLAPSAASRSRGCPLNAIRPGGGNDIMVDDVAD
jgi:hypothetical protein